jgi:transcriptional regulator with XRE-family HTH domain
MPVTDRRADLGRRQGVHLATWLGREIREARHAAGLSQQRVADAAAVSQTLVSRVERATGRRTPLIHLATICAVLGLRLTANVFPDGDAIRDEGQARLLSRLQRILPVGARLRPEVKLAIPGDRRAWDAELRAGGRTCKVEAETVLADLQALDRRIALKMADDDVSVVILLVADTKRNRAVLRAHRELLRDRYPLDSREILATLRAGQCPEWSGVLLL